MRSFAQRLLSLNELFQCHQFWHYPQMIHFFLGVEKRCSILSSSSPLFNQKISKKPNPDIIKREKPFTFVVDYSSKNDAYVKKCDVISEGTNN